MSASLVGSEMCIRDRKRTMMTPVTTRVRWNLKMPSSGGHTRRCRLLPGLGKDLTHEPVDPAKGVLAGEE
eukprot:5033163-Alexandrium_andersonii.AAC.1